MIMATKRKTKTTKRKTQKSNDLLLVRATLELVISKLRKHKLKFDSDYEKGIYDLTLKEANIYDEGIEDCITIIRKM